MTNIPSIARTLGELDGGSLESQATHALREVARAVSETDGTKVKGKVTISLTIERAKGTGQLLISHTLGYQRPTDTGRMSEEANGDTLMYCSGKGDLSVLPQDQMILDITTRQEHAR